MIYTGGPSSSQAGLSMTVISFPPLFWPHCHDTLSQPHLEASLAKQNTNLPSLTFKSCVVRHWLKYWKKSSFFFQSLYRSELMEVIIRPQRFQVKPFNSLVQTGMKGNTKQGYQSSHYPKETTREPDKQLYEMQRNLLEGLRWMSAALGLLPWGAAKGRASCKTKLRFCITVLLAVIVGTAFFFIESKFKLPGSYN